MFVRKSREFGVNDRSNIIYYSVRRNNSAKIIYSLDFEVDWRLV